MAERRSRQFFGEPGSPEGFVPRAFTKKMGYSDTDLQRPVIGIAQTWSEFNSCNTHFRELAEAVKRGRPPCSCAT
jgi:dihydroxy-acid dehydratase